MTRRDKVVWMSDERTQENIWRNVFRWNGTFHYSCWFIFLAMLVAACKWGVYLRYYGLCVCVEALLSMDIANNVERMKSNHLHCAMSRNEDRYVRVYKLGLSHACCHLISGWAKCLILNYFHINDGWLIGYLPRTNKKLRKSNRHIIDITYIYTRELVNNISDDAFPRLCIGTRCMSWPSPDQYTNAFRQLPVWWWLCWKMNVNKYNVITEHVISLLHNSWLHN